jgi:hypothetical protein
MPHVLLRPAGITDGIARTDMVRNGNQTAYHYWLMWIISIDSLAYMKRQTHK